MYNKKIHFLWISLLLALVLGGHYSGTLAHLVRIDSRPVQATNLVNHQIYVPVVLQEFPPPPSSFGVDMGAIKASNGLNEMVQAGNYWVRRDGVDWKSVEPNKGDRNWDALANLESELINAQNKGLQPVVIVSGTPTWAQQYPGYSCGPIKSTEFDAFANFMRDLVSRYSVAPYHVKYWEIWNEPDVSYLFGQQNPDSRYGCWGEPDDPYFGGKYYGEMLKVVTPQIRQANPEVKVIVGGLLLDCDPDNPLAGRTCAESLFLEGILRAGAGDDFDGVSIHAYDYFGGSLGNFYNSNWHTAWNTGGPVFMAKANHIKDILDDPQFGVAGKFIMNTEAALICGGPADPPGLPPCDPDPGSAFELTKAYYVTKVYTVDQALGLLGSVWYSVSGWRNSGLLYSDLTPRPAYAAFAVAQDAIGRAEFVREIDSYAGVEVYELNRDNRVVWVLWSKDGQSHTVNLSSTPISAYDALGQPLSPGLSVAVGLKPIYLEFFK